MPARKQGLAVKPDPGSGPPAPAAASAAKPATNNGTAQESLQDVFEKRKTQLQEALAARGDGAIIYQHDFDSLLPHTQLQLDEMMRLLQALTDANLLSLMQDSAGATCWQVRSAAQASAYAKLNREEHMIYAHIEESGTAGIWTRTLQKRTNLHQQVINRALKALEASKHVKQIKSIKFPSRKIYMLYGLDPGEEVTGGPWFTEGELDVEFIEIVSDLIVRHVQKESWRIGPKYVAAASDAGSYDEADGNAGNGQDDMSSLDQSTRSSRYRQMLTGSNRLFVPHPAGYQDYPTTSELLDWLDGTGVLQDKDLLKADLERMLDMLCFDGRLEKVGRRVPPAGRRGRGAIQVDRDDDDGDDKDGADVAEPEDMFRSTRIPQGEPDSGPGNGFSEAPCSRCPVFRLCEQGGPVDASNCAYFGDWLQPEAITL